MDASRFDAVTRALAAELPRRRLVQFLAALGLGGALARSTARPAAGQEVCPTEVKCPTGYCPFCHVRQGGGKKSCSCGCTACNSNGIAGGGGVALAGGGEAHVALLATRTKLPGQPDAFHVVGQVRWAHPGWEGVGLELESTLVADYGPLPDVEGGRAAWGRLRTPQRPGEFPFLLRALDAGPPGGGRDTVELWVGDALLEDAEAAAGAPLELGAPSGFGYRAEGQLAFGDLQLVNFASPSEAAAPATSEAETPGA